MGAAMLRRTTDETPGSAEDTLKAFDEMHRRTSTRRPSRIEAHVDPAQIAAAAAATAASMGPMWSSMSEVPSEAHQLPPTSEIRRMPSGAGMGSTRSLTPPQPQPQPGRSDTTRRNSQLVFAEKLHTTLVLDWDDTIFPTTWVREELDWRFPLRQQPGMRSGPRLEAITGYLAKHFVRAEEFLLDAARQSNVFIVTLAKRPWVEISMDRFMPELKEVMNQNKFKVIYAQECADQSAIARHFSKGTDDPEEDIAFWSTIKGTAIAKELDEVHNREGISWKNVISFGDSDFERYGTISAGQEYINRETKGGTLLNNGSTPEGVSKDGHVKRLRLKTVKMLDKPTILELTAELVLLKSWLPHIIRRDSGFDLEIEGTDDDGQLVDLNRRVTGAEDPRLSWRELAGMLDE
mmetsp:Transcript_67834/g.196214  ORF Transcript_67834/g.196214 Transcript_67834/m.196214 type:complete len:406 (+) Transcript_67834:33-1250(+)